MLLGWMGRHALPYLMLAVLHLLLTKAAVCRLHWHNYDTTGSMAQAVGIQPAEFFSVKII